VNTFTPKMSDGIKMFAFVIHVNVVKKIFQGQEMVSNISSGYISAQCPNGKTVVGELKQNIYAERQTDRQKAHRYTGMHAQEYA